MLLHLSGFNVGKLSSVALGASLVLGMGTPASAIALNLSSGDWGTPTGGSGITYRTVGGENEIRWGNSEQGGGVDRKSGLGFTGVTASSFELGEVFLLGRLRHFNNPIMQGTAASAVEMLLNLNFGDPAWSNSFKLNLNIDETPNIPGTCVYFSVAACADKISFYNSSLSTDFSIAGVTYTLNLLGFSQNAGTTPINEFISQEGGTSEAFLFGSITTLDPARVPEPMTVAGTGLALLGMRLASNRRGKKGKVRSQAVEKD